MYLKFSHCGLLQRHRTQIKIKTNVYRLTRVQNVVENWEKISRRSSKAKFMAYCGQFLGNWARCSGFNPI